MVSDIGHSLKHGLEREHSFYLVNKAIFWKIKRKKKSEFLFVFLLCGGPYAFKYLLLKGVDKVVQVRFKKIYFHSYKAKNETFNFFIFSFF